MGGKKKMRDKNSFWGKNGTAGTVPDYNKDAAAFNDKEKGGKAVAMFPRPSNIYACQMESGRMAGWKYFWPCMGSLVSGREKSLIIYS